MGEDLEKYEKCVLCLSWRKCAHTREHSHRGQSCGPWAICAGCSSLVCQKFVTGGKQAICGQFGCPICKAELGPRRRALQEGAEVADWEETPDTPKRLFKAPPESAAQRAMRQRNIPELRRILGCSAPSGAGKVLKPGKVSKPPTPDTQRQKWAAVLSRAAREKAKMSRAARETGTEAEGADEAAAPPPTPSSQCQRWSQVLGGLGRSAAEPATFHAEAEGPSPASESHDEVQKGQSNGMAHDVADPKRRVTSHGTDKAQDTFKRPVVEHECKGTKPVVAEPSAFGNMAPATKSSNRSGTSASSAKGKMLPPPLPGRLRLAMLSEEPVPLIAKQSSSSPRGVLVDMGPPPTPGTQSQRWAAVLSRGEARQIEGSAEEADASAESGSAEEASSSVPEFAIDMGPPPTPGTQSQRWAAVRSEVCRKAGAAEKADTAIADSVSDPLFVTGSQAEATLAEESPSIPSVIIVRDEGLSAGSTDTSKEVPANARPEPSLEQPTPTTAESDRRLEERRRQESIERQKKMQAEKLVQEERARLAAEEDARAKRLHAEKLAQEERERLAAEQQRLAQMERARLVAEEEARVERLRVEALAAEEDARVKRLQAEAKAAESFAAAAAAIGQLNVSFQAEAKAAESFAAAAVTAAAAAERRQKLRLQADLHQKQVQVEVARKAQHTSPLARSRHRVEPICLDTPRETLGQTCGGLHDAVAGQCPDSLLQAFFAEHVSDDAACDLRTPQSTSSRAGQAVPAILEREAAERVSDEVAIIRGEEALRRRSCSAAEAAHSRQQEELEASLRLESERKRHKHEVEESQRSRLKPERRRIAEDDARQLLAADRRRQDAADKQQRAEEAQKQKEKHRREDAERQYWLSVASREMELKRQREKEEKEQQLEIERRQLKDEEQRVAEKRQFLEEQRLAEEKRMAAQEQMLANKRRHLEKEGAAALKVRPVQTPTRASRPRLAPDMSCSACPDRVIRSVLSGYADDESRVPLIKVRDAAGGGQKRQMDRGSPAHKARRCTSTTTRLLVKEEVEDVASASVGQSLSPAPPTPRWSDFRVSMP